MIARDNGKLLLGGLLGVDAVDPELGSEPLRDGAAVAGQHRNLDDAVPAQARGELERPLARRIGELEPGDQPAVDADQGAGIPRGELDVDRVRAGVAGIAQEGPAADGDPTSGHGALDALAGALEDVERELEVEPTVLRLADERRRERMNRCEVDRRGEPQRLVFAEPVDAADPSQLRCSEGDGARLVEDDGARVAQRLDHAAALDDDADTRGPRDAGEQGDRGGEDQRTGGRNYEHRQSTDRVARHRPGDGSDDDGERQEERRIPIGHPDERRPLLSGPRGPVGQWPRTRCRRRDV